jgi:hypothetical protein
MVMFSGGDNIGLLVLYRSRDFGFVVRIAIGAERFSSVGSLEVISSMWGVIGQVNEGAA